MNEWFETLDGLLAAAWDTLAQKPSPEVTLASLSPGGWPEARTVILRGADRSAGICQVHTDLGSTKIAGLRGDDRATLVYWDEPSALQIRLRCHARILTWPATRAAWDKVPDRSQPAYGKQPSPGTPIGDALAYKLTPTPKAFAILRLTVHDIDLLHLGDAHRRAAYSRTSDWQGRWLSP